MLVLYKIFSYLVYGWFYTLGRARAMSGDQLRQGRLGLIGQAGPVDLWLHASSLGEARVVSYLVDYLKGMMPALKIHVTTMTPTGFRAIVALLGDRVSLSFFPLDAPPAVRRTVDRIEPKVIVIAETEIWPNLIAEATRRGIPMVQVNGRMSERAFGRYRHIRSLMSGLINKYRRWFFKTEADAARYHHLGLKLEAGEVAGDMKFDAPLRTISADQRHEVRRRAGATVDDFVFVAGSTRSGEEAMLAKLFQAVSVDNSNFKMVVAPRHVERANELAAELEKMNLRWRLYDSQSGNGGDLLAGNGVILVDSMGQLNDIYGAADLAFVGGTLVPIGGHNLLEPVWGQTPVLFGPHIDNVREAAEYILAQNYGRQVDDVDQLTEVVARVCRGELKFAVKTESDLTGSTTARIGQFLLEMVGHA